MGEKTGIFHYIRKSGFVRSVFVRVLAIFIVVSIAIAAIAFFSFASEIRKNILSNRQNQLEAVEDTISKRMDEISSIAYNIGGDSTFYLEPVAGEKYSGYEMSNTLARYLVGNSFIEHLAYYRLSEPDKIYVSSGERSFAEFFVTSLGMSREAAEETICHIRETKTNTVKTLTFERIGKTFFSYTYPLPQFSSKPQAFVLILIPLETIAPIFEPLLSSANSELAVFDADGNEIYRVGTLDDGLPLADSVRDTAGEKEFSFNGTDYILQKVVSDTNGWTYVSAMRRSETFSGLANKLLIFIVSLLVLMLVAVVAMLVSIVSQYQPITNLAGTVTEESGDGGENETLDERVVLSNTIALLKDDSTQKQRFENAYYEAEAASRAKSAFLSNMSHDIRTPMNAVVGMTALALRHADDADYVRECLKKVQVASNYLLDIINNVLDMSRIESGRVTLSEEVIDLEQMVSGLTTILHQSVEDKGLTLTVTVEKLADRLVLGDNTKLLQVCVNILSNSVKFTPAGGRISLSLAELDTAAVGFGNYRFTFSDTGIGMSEAFVGQVFDTFSRASGSDASKVEGTGLGMAIAKNLVELMGGTIECQSTVGKGTTFIVNLPMKLAAGLDAPQKKAAPAAEGQSKRGTGVLNLTGKRVLLAEDNAMNREIACIMIGETHAEVVTALNGQEAVDAFKDQPVGYFDVILMDIQMPVMDGYEATAAIRSMQRPDATTVPIYAMTANTFDEDVRQVLDAGMNGHLGKPYMPETLYALLKEAVG